MVLSREHDDKAIRRLLRASRYPETFYTIRRTPGGVVLIGQPRPNDVPATDALGRRVV